MRNFLLMCALGWSFSTMAQDPQTTIIEYLKGIATESISSNDVIGSWMISSNGYSGEMVEIHANGKAYLHYKNCQGRVRERVQVVINGGEVSVKDGGSIFFRKLDGKVQFFNQALAKEMCALFYKGLCEREELLAKLETCWMDVSSRA